MVQAGDNQLYLLNADGTVIQKLAGAGNQPATLAISPDGTLLAVAAGKGQRADVVYVFEARTGKLLLHIGADQETVHSLAFSPDGKLLAAGQDKTERLWDMATGKELARLRGHQAPVVVLIFSGNGHLLISGGRDKTVRLWEAKRQPAARSRRFRIMRRSMQWHSAPTAAMSQPELSEWRAFGMRSPAKNLAV